MRTEPLHVRLELPVRLRLAGLQALFAWLNLSLTAPAVYLWLGLPLLMRQQGWSGLEIGLFQLAGLPAVFKVLLARPVEGRRQATDRPQRSAEDLSRYRTWAVALCLSLAVVLMLLGWRQLLDSRAALFSLAFAAAWLATWADIPVNALAIRCLPSDEQLRAGAWRSAALSIGAIVGGGVMLMVQLRWGWRAPFWLLAAMLVTGAAAIAIVSPRGLMSSVTAAMPATAAKAAAAAMPAAAPPPMPAMPAMPAVAGRPAPSLARDLSGYLAQPGARAWTVLLMLYFPFIGTAWFYLKPLLLDLGFHAEQVAFLVGIGGGVIATASSLVTGQLARRIGLDRAVPLGAWLASAALAALALASSGHLPASLVIVAAGLVAAAMGGIAALSFALTMRFARPSAAAADYGLQASLFALSRLLVPLAGGLVLDRHGYPVLLVILLLAMLGVVVLCHYSAAALGWPRTASHRESMTS